MIKKVLIISLILFGFTLMPKECLAEASAKLDQAEACMENIDYEQAETIYKTIVTDYPGTNDALAAQEGLVMLYIIWGKQPQAKTAFEKLIADFSSHPDIAKSVYDIAYCYGELHKNYEKARDLQQYVLENWPQSETAIWSQADLAACNISLGDDPNAEAAIEKLLTEFSDNNDIAQAVYDVADHYGGLQQNKRARDLYKYALDNWPDSEAAIWSQANLAACNISLGDDPNAQAAVDKLLGDFSGHPDIAKAVSDLADHYGEVHQYEKARELHQHVLENWPDSEVAIWSQAGLAACNIILGDDPNAQAATDSLIADFNSHPDFQAALYDIAGGYEDLYKYEEAKSIYQQIIQQFPEASRAQLGIHKCQILIFIDNGNDTAAQTAIDTLIVDFNEHPDLPDAISNIEEAYYIRILAAETWVRENYLHPIEIWEKVTQKFPDFFYNDPDLYYFIACCYYQLGEYEVAIGYYGIVIDNWPDYKYTWGAQRLIDTCFERLTNAKK